MTKKALVILIPLSFICIACEQPDEEPPSITITYPKSGSILSDTVNIICESSDYRSVKKVKLYLDDSFVDNMSKSYPFTYIWNTTIIEDGTHWISAISYDHYDNSAESETVTIVVDNAKLYPTRIDLRTILYESESFIISWSPSREDNFDSYKLYESLIEDMSDSSIIHHTNSRNDISFVISNIGENERRYYQLGVVNTEGFENKSQISVGSSFNEIVFISNRNGRDEIYVMDTDGGNQRRLTNISGRKESPKYSPDGSKLAFTLLFLEHYYQIVTMDQNGENPIVIGGNNYEPISPSFSPDGSRIVFRSNDSGNSEIYCANTDGTNQVKLTNNPGSDRFPIYSPDGSTIVFESFRNDAYNIYTMDATGDNQTKITNCGGQFSGLIPFSYSPDGSKILYSFRANLYIMNADGSNQTELTDDTKNLVEHSAEFSLDGSKIVFVGDRDYYLPKDGTEIFLININGSGYTRLTDNTVVDRYPRFSPDGSKIIFSSNRDGNYEIYIMDLDGSNVINLTNNPYNEWDTSFEPH